MNIARIAVLDEQWGKEEALCQLLQGVAEVVNFNSGEELLRSRKCDTFDCILIDAGIARKMHLQLIERGCTTPVIYLASQASVADAVMAVKSGAVDYLCKPLDSAQLSAAMEAALRQKRTGVPDRFFAAPMALDPMLDVLERELICTALLRTRGVVGGRNGAAALLGVTRTGLLYKMKRLNISRALLEEGEREGAGEAEGAGLLDQPRAVPPNSNTKE